MASAEIIKINSAFTYLSGKGAVNRERIHGIFAGGKELEFVYARNWVLLVWGRMGLRVHGQ